MWVSEARMQELCKVPRSTWQSWTRESLVEPAPKGEYGEGAVLEVALVKRLREYFSLRDAVQVWATARRTGIAENLVDRARQIAPGDRFDVVVEPQIGRIALCTDDDSLVRAVRVPEDPRLVIVVPMETELLRVRDGFWTFATSGAPRRPTRRTSARADVRELQDRRSKR